MNKVWGISMRGGRVKISRSNGHVAHEILPVERTRVEMTSATPIAKREELNFDLRRKMCMEMWPSMEMGGSSYTLVEEG